MFDIDPFQSIDDTFEQPIEGRPRRQRNDIDTLFTATTGLIQRVSDLEKEVVELKTRLGFMAEIVSQTRKAVSPMEAYAKNIEHEYEESQTHD